jgi:GDPmannose 4,6-dehydratase
VDEQAVVDAVEEAGGIMPVCTPGAVVVSVDPHYFRPTEVDTLLGNPDKARTRLGWQPRVTFDELVREMVKEDIELALRDQHVRDGGYKLHERFE